MARAHPPVHPFGPPLLALATVGILGAGYWAFGLGKDAFYFALAALVVLAMPVVVTFGIAGIVLGVRRLVDLGLKAKGK